MGKVRAITDILADMEQCQTVMHEYHGKSNDTDIEESKRKEYGVLFNKKRAEFDAFSGELNDVKAMAEVQSTINHAKDLSKPDFGNTNFNPETPETKGKTSGEGDLQTKQDDGFTYQSKCDAFNNAGTIELALDPVKDQLLKGKIFADWFAFGSGAIEGEALAAIQCKDARALKMAEGRTVCSMPKFMAQFVRAKSVRRGGHDYLIDGLEGKVILSTDATGGATDSGAANLLAPDFRALLLEYPIYAPQLYNLCQQFRSYNGSVEWPMLDQDQGDYGGVAFTWKSTEGADKGETEPVFTDFTLNTHELSGWTELSLQALRRSSIDLQSTIMRLFRNAAVAEWSNKILHGSGSNQPLGVLHANASNVISVARQVANQVSWKDLTQLEFAIRRAQRYGAQYIVDDSVEQYLKDTLDGQGRPLFTADVHSQIRNQLAGYNYVTHDYGSVPLGTTGDVVYGNWNSYAWAMEEEIAIARSEHAEFKKGRVVYRMICFVGGKPIYQTHFAKLAA